MTYQLRLDLSDHAHKALSVKNALSVQDNIPGQPSRAAGREIVNNVDFGILVEESIAQM
jgi:hypothetical protein